MRELWPATITQAKARHELSTAYDRFFTRASWNQLCTPGKLTVDREKFILHLQENPQWW